MNGEASLSTFTSQVADSATSSPDSPTVVDELVNGEGVSFTQAAKLLPAGRAGKATSPATIWRWAREGAKAPGGAVVRLEVARCGCRWVTTRAALTRFLS